MSMLGRGRSCIAWLMAATIMLLLPSTAGAQQQVRRYTIQAVATSSPAQAEQRAELVRQGLGPGANVRVEHHPPYHTVRVGHFSTAHEARRMLSQIWELGYKDAWIARTMVSASELAHEEPGLRTDSQVRPVAVQPEEEAQPAEARPAGDRMRKTMRASHVEDQPPKIDGRLDDPVWSSATFVSDFEQRGATRGLPARAKTEVAFLYDKDALYVGARAQAKNPAAVRVTRSARDDPADADRLIVSLDTYRNRQTAYNFGVTAGGTRLDYYQPRDVFGPRDHSFNPVWEARTARHATGWTAEMRIPLSHLPFHAADSLVWGVNVQRLDPKERLNVFWVVVPGNETGWASRFGDLVGVAGVGPRRRFAVVPYVSGQGVFSDFESSPDDPFARTDGEMQWNYGGDLLVDVTPTVTFEATFNPDFGQIEADPAVVNLTAFETFFPEKRPFFLEGADLFRGRGPRYFYSRRIGAPPHGDVNDQFREEPASTTILGAAKLIGRTSSGLSVGAMAALSDQERARTFDPETGTFDGVPVEPETFFGVSRIQKDLGAGSTFGFVGTAVRRDVSEGETLAALLPRQAYAGGFDWSLRFAGGSHEFGGFGGASIADGDSTVIRRLQLSSARYYQRPDADYVDFDPGRTTLAGYTGGFRLARIRGAWRWTMSGEARSPGFEINDAGAMATADDLIAYAQTGYWRPIRFGPWKRFDLSGSVSSGWNFGGDRQFTTPAVNLSLGWDKFWRTYTRVSYDTRALSDNLTRGGPLMGTGRAWRTQFGLASNSALRHRLSLDGSYTTDEFGGWGFGLSTEFSTRPNAHVELSITPGYERGRDSRQFFEHLPNGPPETFGVRYVFAALDRSTVYTRLRAGLAITSSAGFEFYAEPFAASGSYSDFGELEAARSRDLRLYGTDGTTIVRLEDGSFEVTDGDQTFALGNGDFDFRSFRSNFVFRWDYMQGSTIYLVWQQNRLAQDFRGKRVGAQDLFEVFDAPGEDILAVKATFRVGFD